MRGNSVDVRRVGARSSQRGAYRDTRLSARRGNRDDEEHENENKFDAIKYGKACYPLREDER